MPPGPWANISRDDDSVELRCSGTSCPANCQAGYDGDYGGPCTACPVGKYGYGAPYVCGDTTSCVNVGRTCSGACSTYQSSTYASDHASKAVDGNANTACCGSCSHTLSEYRPWWRVDFGASRNLVMIHVYGRSESPARERLNNWQVRIGNSGSWPNNAICTRSRVYPTPTNTVLLSCKGRGRFLHILIDGTNFLTLCEVIAYGPNPGWDWNSECASCPAGKSSPAGSDTSSDCYNCPAGKYSYSGGSCSSCPTGTYSPAASDACTCNAGYFGPLGGPCTACVAGKYRAWSAASSSESNCVHCDSGKYALAAAGACLDCEVGKRAPDKGMGACIECEHGNRCPARRFAIPCAAGEL